MQRRQSTFTKENPWDHRGGGEDKKEVVHVILDQSETSKEAQGGGASTPLTPAPTTPSFFTIQ